jgi:CheY-like chemotaxis protein
MAARTRSDNIIRRTMATTQPTPRQGSPALWNGSVLRARAAAAPSWYAGAHAAERVRPSVLVCDDDSQNLRALKAVLSSAGFAVDATSTSNQALDHAALRAPIAAIVELVLPDGDGVELCRALREWSTMPLIVLSESTRRRTRCARCTPVRMIT